MRVTIIQPSIPKYRLPVYARLAQRDGIALRIIYGTEAELPTTSHPDVPAQPYSHPGFTIGGRYLTWIWDQIRWGSPKRSDVLVLEWNLERLSLVPAIVHARARGVRVLLWGHGLSRVDSRARYLGRRLVGRLADGVIVYEWDSARALVDDGLDPNRVYVAQNALDQQEIQEQRRKTNAEEIEQFRIAHGLDDGAVILHVSRLEPHRRLDVLIEALGVVRRSVPQAELVIIGDGVEKEKLQGFARSVGVHDAITWVPGIYEEEELAPWFLASSAYCFPEGIGLSLFHSFGYGVPVVVGDRIAAHGPEARAIRAEDNALLFHHGDPNDLARQISRLLTDSELSMSLRASAASTVESEFTIERMTDGFERAIRGDDPQWND